MMASDRGKQSTVLSIILSREPVRALSENKELSQGIVWTRHGGGRGLYTETSSVLVNTFSISSRKQNTRPCCVICKASQYHCYPNTARHASPRQFHKALVECTSQRTRIQVFPDSVSRKTMLRRMIRSSRVEQDGHALVISHAESIRCTALSAYFGMVRIPSLLYKLCVLEEAASKGRHTDPSTLVVQRIGGC